jgi:hypothetical protein
LPPTKTERICSRCAELDGRLLDLHAHTRPLSHDSALSPDDLVEAAKNARLDGIA